ncbi:MAG: hypothetical protein CMC04_05445 [Flavobacteriaceae bacterium]|nr:hypothetical protein [Flavobacteriaceae bacterium]|tara:strand:+ start:3138 stop:4010 length:873 start_codon:yes stop_codon:yes gene_type:complete
MKVSYILLILFIPFIGFGQQTFIPDDNFEQSLIEMGLDDTIDNYVNTNSIDTLKTLNLSYKNISSMVGIEDFESIELLYINENLINEINLDNNLNLKYFNCSDNYLLELNLNNNQGLLELNCGFNEISSIDISQNTNLEILSVHANLLNEINTDFNTSLRIFDCSENNISSIDISNNNEIYILYCFDNFLSELNLNNITKSLSILSCSQNPNLYCIQVSDENYAYSNFNLYDEQQYFSENCNMTSLDDIKLTNKFKISEFDLFGRKTNIKNQPVIEIYNDRSVEKKVIIE